MITSEELDSESSKVIEGVEKEEGRDM